MKLSILFGSLIGGLAIYAAYRKAMQVDLPPQTLRLKAYSKWINEVNEDARRRAALAAEWNEQAS